MTYFTYNGIGSADFGLHIESKAVFSAPEYNVTFEAIPGRHGDLPISNNRFNNIKISYTVFLAKKNAAELSSVFTRIKGWLYTKPDSYHEITDSYDTEHKRFGVISGSLDIEEQFNKLGLFTVTFNCKPFRYEALPMGFGIMRAPSSSSASLPLTNPYLFESKPLITLTGTGGGTLTVASNNNTAIWNISEIGGTLVCDSELMNWYSGTTLKNGFVTGDGFPLLAAGVSTVTIEGGVSRVDIMPRWCTL